MSSTMINTRNINPLTEHLTPTTVNLTVYVRTDDVGVQMFRMYGSGTDAMVDYYGRSSYRPWEWSTVRPVGHAEALKAQKTLRRKNWIAIKVEVPGVMVNGRLDYDVIEAAEMAQAVIQRRRNAAIKRERQLRAMGL